MPALLVYVDDKWVRYDLDEDETLIGRHPDCEFCQQGTLAVRLPGYECSEAPLVLAGRPDGPGRRSHWPE